jgi:putative hydrolase of the HAD superfamily
MDKIKAIIFDLDDTILDNEPLVEGQVRQAISVMIERGFRADLEEAVKKIIEIIRGDVRLDKFRELAKYYDHEDDEIVEAGKHKYKTANIENLRCFPGTRDVLDELNGKFKLVLLTQGNPEQQQKKIDMLDIREYFDFAFTPEDEGKREALKDALEVLELNPNEILVVGDRIDVEIAFGNDMGMKTVRLLKGKYRNMVPENDGERADFEIRDLNEVLDIVNE